VLIVFTKTHD